MGRKKSYNGCIQDGREVRKILSRNGCNIREGKGSHRVGTLPNGNKITFHEHGETGKGLGRKWFKILAGAGLLGFIFLYLYGYLLIGG